VVVLPLVRIWVRMEAASSSVGRGERCLWGLHGLKTWWGEKEGRKMLAGTAMAGFLADFRPKFLHLWGMKIKYIYRRWKMDTLSLLVQNLNLWFEPKASQPLAQSSNDELSVLCGKNSWSSWQI